MRKLIFGLMAICTCLSANLLSAQTYYPNFDPKSWISYPDQQGNPGEVVEDMIVDPGEYILQAGVPECNDGRLGKAAEEASSLSTALITEEYPELAPVAKYGGAIVGQYVHAMQVSGAGFSGSIASLFSDLGMSPRYATCGTAAFVVPMGYHITGYSFMAQNLAQFKSGVLLAICNIQEPPYLKCPLPDGRFANTQAGNVVISTFINWSRDVRFVRMIIYFQPN